MYTNIPDEFTHGFVRPSQVTASYALCVIAYVVRPDTINIAAPCRREDRRVLKSNEARCLTEPACSPFRFSPIHAPPQLPRSVAASEFHCGTDPFSKFVLLLRHCETSPYEWLGCGVKSTYTAILSCGVGK